MPKKLKELYSSRPRHNGLGELITRTKFWNVLVLLLCLVFIPYAVYVKKQNNDLQDAQIKALQVSLQSKINTFNALLNNMGGALNVVSHLPDIQYILASNGEIRPATKNFLNELLLTFKRFDQIAIINDQGDYRFLVYKDIGQAVMVTPEKLGQFEDQNFFRQLRNGRENYTYISTFYFEPKPNSLHDFMPSFYLSMPLFNQQDEFIGAIVLKIALDLRYQRISENAAPTSIIQHMDIFNGDWFVNDLNPQLSLLGGREANGNGVRNDNPSLWEALSTHKSGIYEDDQGIFVYTSVMPLAQERANDSAWRFDPAQLGDYQYIFVNLISWQNLHALTPWKTQLLAGIVLFAIVTFIAFVVATRIENSEFVREKSQQLEDLFHLNDAIIDNLGAALIGIDQQGTITRFSRHAENLFGYQAEEVEGSNVKILMRADIAAKHDGFLSDYVKDTQAGMSKIRSILGKTRVLIAKAKDGNEFPVEIVVTKVPFGDTYRFVGLITDISERLSMQSEIDDALTQAKHASEHKTAFLARMSHEIRTPMNGIYGTLQLLRSRLKDSENHELIEKSIYSCKALLTIINDILDISKIEANRVDLEALPFNFVGIINDVINDLKSPAEQKGLRLKVEGLDTFRDGWIGDPTRIRQILINLTANALKFTAEGGITIKVSNSRNGSLIFSVQDTGIGIEAEHIERLFQPYEQADKTTARRFRGSGLGMSICHELCRLMDGKISVDSTMGLGTTFTVSLPLKSIAVAPLEDYTFSEVPDLKGHKILLAEDNVVNQTVFEAMINDTLADITIANDGNEAMALIDSGDFEIVFMDIHMPNMDGVTCCKKIKDLNPLTPIIAVTANVQADDIANYKAQGFDDVMPKPFELSHLYALLIKYLDTHKLRRRV